MPINTPQMLGELSRTMKQQAELLEALQPELGEVSLHAAEVVREASINTAVRLLPRYERIFAIKASGRTLEERRAAILAALNARMLMTRAQMEALAAALSKRPVEVREYPPEYRFEVVLFPGSAAVNDAMLHRGLAVYKPAHLEMKIVHEAPLQAAIYPADAWWLVEEITMKEVF